jgi:drug/metabolite transporter (DMT)-like permease
MSPTLVATLAGLVTAVAYGTSDWLSARSTKKLDPLQINFAVQTLSLVVVGILFLFSTVHIDNSGQLVRIVLSSLFVTTGYLVLIRALSGGAVGVVVPLANIYPLFTILLAIIFNTTRFHVGQLMAMLVIVVGVVILAYEKNHRQIPFKELHMKTALALLAAIVWGVGFFLIDPVVKHLSWQTITIVGEPFSFALALILILYSRRGQAWSAMKQGISSSSALLAGATAIVGGISIYIGSVRAGSVAIPTVLSAGGPLIASLWGALIDHERLGVLKRVGAVVVVSGIIILNVA